MEMSSCVIYGNVPRNEIHDMDRERVEMMVEIYEGGDDFRTQTDSNTNRQQLQCTGSKCVKNRSLRSVLVCLVVLCVLILTAVIVLSVLIYTNNHQFNINNKHITQERDQLLTNNTKLTKERDQLLTNNTNITEERDELRAKYNNITKLYEQLRTNFYEVWIYYESSLYYVSSEKKSWNQSRSYCRERGADLIIINNKVEQDFVSKMSGPEFIWIGLSDSEVEGRWKWVDGSTMNYRSWAKKEPNGRTNENCVMSSVLSWIDQRCSDSQKWICERKRVNVAK